MADLPPPQIGVEFNISNAEDARGLRKDGRISIDAHAVVVFDPVTVVETISIQPDDIAVITAISFHHRFDNFQFTGSLTHKATISGINVVDLTGRISYNFNNKSIALAYSRARGSEYLSGRFSITPMPTTELSARVLYAARRDHTDYIAYDAGITQQLNKKVSVEISYHGIIPSKNRNWISLHTRIKF